MYLDIKQCIMKWREDPNCIIWRIPFKSSKSLYRLNFPILTLPGFQEVQNTFLWEFHMNEHDIVYANLHPNIQWLQHNLPTDFSQIMGHSLQKGWLIIMLRRLPRPSRIMMRSPFMTTFWLLCPVWTLASAWLLLVMWWLLVDVIVQMDSQKSHTPFIGYVLCCKS